MRIRRRHLTTDECIVIVTVISVLGILIASAIEAFSAVPRYSVNMPKRYVEQVVSFGRADVGKTERTGNNDGKHIDRYAKAVGMPLRSAYCYAAIYTWCDDAALMTGLVNPMPQTGSTQSAYNVAAKTFRRAANDSPRRGDVLIWRIPRKWLGHAALIVTARKNGLVETIEANTSRSVAGNQRDGGGVWTKQRFINRAMGRLVVRGLIAIGK